MSKTKVSIKDIAEMAGVSIATVSHVINRTRYVRPELVERVERIVRETGYIEKVREKEKRLRVGKGSIIMGLFPDLSSDVYRDLVAELKVRIETRGYYFYLAVTDDDADKEQQLIEGMLNDKRIAGLFLVPAGEKAEAYRKLAQSDLPVVCLERTVKGDPFASALFQDRESMRLGTSYLLESGHVNLMYLRESNSGSSKEERTAGYLDALGSRQQGTLYTDSGIVDVDLGEEESDCIARIQREIRRVLPTAVIASGNRLTLYLLKAIRNAGIRCPEELSVIGYGDSIWTDLMNPPITTFQRNAPALADAAIDLLAEQINKPGRDGGRRYVPVTLTKRESVRMIESGPYGEKAVSVSQITLTQEERRAIRSGKYRAAIVFHYMGTAWSELHERGIRDELEQYNIDVISVTDAHFDPALQNVQLEGLMLQHPDAVIAVPADDRETSEAFRKLSEESRLVFLGSIPEDIGRNNYVSYVSVNEWENGTNVGRLIGEHFKGVEHVCLGLLNHGATFYGTQARDQAVEKTIREEYPNIEIVTTRSFSRIENADRVCRDMMTLHPEITALYVSWDQPALRAIRTLREMWREDVAVFTTDLDKEIAGYMKEGLVCGMSTQRPYEQGRAAGLVLAKSLVAEGIPKYVGVQPYVVKPNELPRAWKDIFHVSMPNDL